MSSEGLKLWEPKPDQVPRSMFVHCPKTGTFEYTRVADDCLVCQHYVGMIENGGGEKFELRYTVACAHPVARRIHVIRGV